MAGHANRVSVVELCLVPCRRDKVVTWLCRAGDVRVLLAWARAMFTTLTRTASPAATAFASRTSRRRLAKEAAAGNRAAPIKSLNTIIPTKKQQL